jgi:hypothetical protein
MSNSQHENRLLHRHRLHLGLYARVAKELNTSPSYVSLVAAGKRPSDKILRAIIVELKRIDKIRNTS